MQDRITNRISSGGIQIEETGLAAIGLKKAVGEPGPWNIGEGEARIFATLRRACSGKTVEHYGALREWEDLWEHVPMCKFPRFDKCG